MTNQIKHMGKKALYTYTIWLPDMENSYNMIIMWHSIDSVIIIENIQR